ncbi:MAG: cytochrome c oxidase assembly protein [Caldilinea sp. CFX5]|nr:cytochrome c oxidase assembly protein [Caldilinea sp. CFX5]
MSKRGGHLNPGKWSGAHGWRQRIVVYYQAMTILDWLLRLLIIGALGLLWLGYLRGWRRWRRVDADLANPIRLIFLGLSTLLILVAFFPPLARLSHDFLVARAVQKIALAFIAAPLLWLAAPFHLISCGLPVVWRRRLVRWAQPHRWSGWLTRACTQPAVAWFAFVAAIVLWHDTHVVNWTMPQAGVHGVLMLLLLTIALLYWGHLVGTGPRRLHHVPGWVLFVYVVGVEIPNMATGMTIAYAAVPWYTYYVNAHALLPSTLTAQEDQMLSGGLIWFTGSFVFFGSAVLVINRLFRRHKGESPHHFPDWDSEERMIAPGLEHRLKEKRSRY